MSKIIEAVLIFTGIVVVYNVGKFVLDFIEDFFNDNFPKIS